LLVVLARDINMASSFAVAPVNSMLCLHRGASTAQGAYAEAEPLVRQDPPRPGRHHQDLAAEINRFVKTVRDQDEGAAGLAPYFEEEVCIQLTFRIAT
jgi:hypothetical protein